MNKRQAFKISYGKLKFSPIFITSIASDLPGIKWCSKKLWHWHWTTILSRSNIGQWKLGLTLELVTHFFITICTSPSVCDLALSNVFISSVFFYICSIQNADDIIETNITEIHSVLFLIEKSLKVPKNTVFNHLKDIEIHINYRNKKWVINSKGAPKSSLCNWKLKLPASFILQTNQE